MGETLYEKIYKSHTIAEIGPGYSQLFVGLHLIHEATSAPAFDMLRERKLRVLYPQRTFATADHVIPTDTFVRPYVDPLGEAMITAFERNTEEFGIRFFAPSRNEHGIVHVIGPEKGLTQPGTVICCGDSHTSSHGAFGSIAFGIGTSQVRDVLATQSIVAPKLKVRRIEVNGALRPGVVAKDVILHIINRLGVKSGVGYAYEFAGDVIDNMSMDGRMTICNMAVEGGARCGYVNPDDTTISYLEGRECSPTGAAWEKAVEYWRSVASDADAEYDDLVKLQGEDIEPMVTWGIHLGQVVPVNGTIPDSDPSSVAGQEDAEARQFMRFEAGAPIRGTKIDVAFIGSCTNGRVSDFLEIAEYLKKGSYRVAENVRTLVVPGSQQVRDELIARGVDKIFRAAGFDFREAGCSMCLAMNTDKLVGSEVCASSSNRNFKGRQGSPTGRTLIMSPVMVAAAAIAGEVTDARELFSIH